MIADRYELTEQIGTGGMATVWRATDTLLGRSVAVKRLLPHLAMDPRAAERFKREAQSAARLSHPGIVTVFDTGEDEEGPFIILELIEGETLAANLAEAGSLSPDVIVDIVSQVGSALDHAHALGVVHRDIKPANLILDSEGRVRLTDFGIARTVDDPTTITATGELVGTISYIAPELLEDAPATPASDVYSLAAVTYELLAGRPPFSAETPAALLEAVRRAEPPSLRGTASDEMAAVVATGMSKSPSRRPPTAGTFASELIGSATLVLGSGGVTPRVDPPAPTITFVGSEEPTVVTSPPRPIPAEPVPTPGHRSRWPLFAVLLGVLALAAVAMSTDRDPAEADGPLEGPLAAETTTTARATTTAPTTTSTMAATTTVLDSPESVAIEIENLLAALQAPQFKPKDVRQVEDRLDRVMEEWERDNRDDLKGELERSFDAVGALDKSAQRDQLTEWFIQLAELMGVEVDQSRQENDEDDD